MEQKLKNLFNNAYAPYSNYRVSAIIRCNDGQEFSGVNVENASYSGTICAERVAITAAVAYGYKKEDIKEIHIMADDEMIVSPCFICRQTFVELLDNETDVFLYNNNGNMKKYKVKDLCPLPFNYEYLKVEN